jgi:hypothetical protein
VTIMRPPAQRALWLGEIAEFGVRSIKPQKKRKGIRNKTSLHASDKNPMGQGALDRQIAPKGRLKGHQGLFDP